MEKEPIVEITEILGVDQQGKVLEESEVAPVIEGADPLLGSLLDGKYQIEEILATGGMCRIYRAKHVVIDKNVAVKVLLPQMAMDEMIKGRFEQEARATSRFSHPHAIDISDFGWTPQKLPFIVMDLVAGEPLGGVLRREGPLSLERAGLLLRQICSALEAAHAEGVIHRDLKPDNIMVSVCDGEDWVTVVDFGIAKIQEGLHQGGVRTTGNTIFGTPRYMSPEQAEGRPVDSRSDIYSLGIMLYEMLVGEVPFTDDSSVRVLIKHATEPPPSPRIKRPDLPLEVEAVVLRALAKDPAERPQSAAGLSRAFADAISTVDTATIARIHVPFDEPPAPPIAAEAPIVRRRRWPLAIAATLVLALAGGTGYLFLAQPSPTVAPSDLWNQARAFLPFLRQPASSAAEALDEARRQVTEARARIESLPENHELRRELPQLIQWQGELDGYRATPEPTAQMTEQGREIARLAGRLVEQAESAAAMVKRQTVPPVPAQEARKKGGAAGARPARDEDEEEMEGEEEEEEEPLPAEQGVKARAHQKGRRTQIPAILPKAVPGVDKLPVPPPETPKKKEGAKPSAPTEDSVEE